MKYLQRLCLFLAVSFTIFSCQKEYSVENNTGGSNVTAQWSFSEGGVQYKGPIDTVSVDSVGQYLVLSVNGHSEDKQDLINLEIFGTDLKVGTYKTPYCLFAYAHNGLVKYQTNQTAVDSFTIVITKLDSTGIIGTFSGKAYDSAKNYKTIVDGKFSSVFKTTSTPPASTDSGQVVFWGKSDCKGSTGAESIRINGKSGQITTYGTAEPTTCDPAGSFNIKLPVGSYPWVAKCGTDSITGTVTVTKGGCTKVQVDFTAPPPVVSNDYFPTTTGSNWVMLLENQGSGDSTVTFSTSRRATVSGKTYNVFTYTDYASQDTGSFNYRKDATPVYYEYFPPTNPYLQLAGATTGIEYVMLNETLAVNAAFPTASVTGTTQGQSVKVQVDGKILEKNVTVTVSGKSFTNVIKVRNSISYVILGATTEAARIERWYAKGIGVIKQFTYIDAPAFTTPKEVRDIIRADIK